MNVMLERHDADSIKSFCKHHRIGVGRQLAEWYRRECVLREENTLKKAKEIGESCDPPKTVDEILRDSVQAVHHHRFRQQPPSS